MITSDRLSHSQIDIYDIAYDVAVVGAGPAGCMGAIHAARNNRKIVLLETNHFIGKKLLLTGKGRCNITNTAQVDTFIEKFAKHGAFLRCALFKFSNQDLIEFFQGRGLKLESQRQGRVFPVTDKAADVVGVLKQCLQNAGVRVLYDSRLKNVKKKKDLFYLNIEGKKSITAKKVILATGGASYKATGSCGDGFKIAKQLGHAVTALKPALVPLKTKEPWVKELQGLPLKNIRITLKGDKAKIVSDVGEFIFTHFGVSGPLVLDLSGKVVSMLTDSKQLRLYIDLKPGLTNEQIDARLLREFKTKGSTCFKNLLKEFLPRRLISVFMDMVKIDSVKKSSQISQSQRRTIVSLLKALPLTITGSLNIEEAMVTAGGVFLKEINPRTMESKIVPGLYFAGEIIDGCAPSGGYNLQQAFSTGYLAGECAKNSV